VRKTDHVYKHALDHSPDRVPVYATQKPKNPSMHNPTSTQHLSLLRESSGEALHVAVEAALVAEELNVGTVHQDGTGGLLLQVLLAAERGEAPVLGDDDLLPAGELVLGATEGLESGGLVCGRLLEY
jgi:hypothetical protein